MEGFNSFAAAFCTACVLIGALYILCPEGALSKPVKYVFSLVFILIIVAAAAGLRNIDIEYKPSAAGISVSDDMTVAAAERAYANALIASGINFSKIEVLTDKSDSGSIVISRVKIYSRCDAALITDVIGTPQGYEVEIINE